MKKTIAIILSIMLVLAVTLPVAAISTIALKSIKLNSSTITMKVGKTSNLKVTLIPANTSQNQLTYVTGNKQIATVDKTGKITGVKAGTTTITVYTPNKKIFAKCIVTISQFASLTPYTVNFVLTQAVPDITHQQAVENFVDNYLKDKIENTKLHFEFIDGANYINKTNLMLASGEQFDLMGVGGQVNISQLYAKGSIIPMDGLLNQYGQDILSQVEAKYWPSVTIGGKKVSIPYPFVYASSFGFAYKKDLVDKYSFDYKSVKSIKDLEPLLKSVKENEKGIIPYWSSKYEMYSHDQFDSIITPFLGYSLADNKVEWVYDNAKVSDNVKALQDFYTKGYISKDQISKTDEVSEKKSGKYAVTNDWGQVSADGSKETAMSGYPCYSSLYDVSVVGTGSVQSCCVAISATSKDPARAMMIQNLLFKDKFFLNTCAYGLENIDYTVVAGKGTVDPTVLTNKDMKWGIWHCWIGSLWSSWGNANWNTSASLAAMKHDTDAAAVSPILGFIFNAEPVKNEIAQVTALVNESEKVLAAGMEPDATKYLADFKDKANKAGLDKITQEAEKQIADWKAKNGK